jgi:uncharacterized membrane protein
VSPNPRSAGEPAIDAPTSRRSRIDASFVVALIGLALSIYLTVEHYTSPTILACPATATINCVKVTTSSYSVIAGIPVAVLGLLYYVGMAILVSPPAWRIRQLDLVRIAGAALGVLMVLYLVWVELFRVFAICLWCTAVHVCTLVLLGTILWRVAGREPADAS